VLQSIAGLGYETGFKGDVLRGKRRAVAGNATWRVDIGRIRPRKIGTEVGIAFALQAAVEHADTTAHDQAGICLEGKADARREVERLARRQTFVAHIL